MNPILNMLLVLITSLSLFACSAVDSTIESSREKIELQGIWQVEDIDQGGVIDNAMVNIEFLDNGRVAGSTGCNQFSGELQSKQNAFVISKAVTTRRACTPAIANQESRFLAALNAVTHYKVKDQTWVVIYDAVGKPRLTLIRMSPSPAPKNMRMDISDSQLYVKGTKFQCDELGEMHFRLLGPETVEVSIGDTVDILQRAVSASGAKYTSDEMTFWNNGEEAYLNLNSNQYKCEKR